jgi:hypothetical protein
MAGEALPPLSSTAPVPARPRWRWPGATVSTMERSASVVEPSMVTPAMKGPSS